MFPWNIAKSAEAMFSLWAVKRVCKFLLKKKLGQFILGDIDLDQLDVQLSNGTIQLTDLALNADFLNKKVCTAKLILGLLLIASSISRNYCIDLSSMFCRSASIVPSNDGGFIL